MSNDNGAFQVNFKDVQRFTKIRVFKDGGKWSFGLVKYLDHAGNEVTSNGLLHLSLMSSYKELQQAALTMARQDNVYLKPTNFFELMRTGIL